MISCFFPKQLSIVVWNNLDFNIDTCLGFCKRKFIKSKSYSEILVFVFLD